MNFTTLVTVGGEVVVWAVPRGTAAEGKANSIFIPLGPLHSSAFLLLPGDSARLLSPSDSLAIVWKQVPIGPGATVTLSFPGWRLVRSERLLPGGPNQNASLYLCEFADGRYFAGLNSDSGTITTNLRSYANASDYLAGTSGGTWDNLVSTLWSACSGLLGSYPGLPVGLPIDGVPESTWMVGTNAYRCLNAVLNHLDCAIAPDPFSTNYSIVQLGATQERVANAARLKWNSEPIDGQAAAPATVKTYFMIHRKAYGQERDTELANNWAYNGAIHTVSNDTNLTGAVGTKGLWDDLPLILDETGTQTNSAAVNSRALNRMTRYKTRKSNAIEHKIFSGLLSDYVPGAQIKAVLWRNWGDGERNPFGGTVTEYICRSDLVTGYGFTNGEPAWFDSALAAPEQETYSPVEFSRRGYGNATYPRLPNVVQVTAGAISPSPTAPEAGTVVQPNADGFHKGVVRRWVNNSMATLDPCWIRFIDNHDAKNGQVPAIQGEFYGPGRLSGVSTSTAAGASGGGSPELLPVYLVRAGLADQLVFYELATDQYLPTSVFGFQDPNIAIIKILKRNDQLTWVDSGVRAALIQEFPIPTMFTGVKDVDRGWGKFAFKAGDLPFPIPTALANFDFYNPVFQSGPAHLVYFLLLEDVSLTEDPDHPGYYKGTQASPMPAGNGETGENNGYFLYGHDRLFEDPGADLKVYIRVDTFKAAKEDALGWAVYNDRERVYEVLQVDQLCILAHGKLYQKLCGEPTASIIDFKPDTPFPFSMIPEKDAQGRITAINPAKHRGKQGDYVKLTMTSLFSTSGDFLAFGYEVTDPEKKKFLVGSLLELHGDYYTQETVEAALEYCEDPVDNVIPCCAGCCPCCTVCPGISTDVAARLVGVATETDPPDRCFSCPTDDEGLGWVELAGTESVCHWENSPTGTSGRLCTDNLRIVIDIVQEDGECILRGTVTGTAIANSSGFMGGAYEVIYEKSLGAGPVNCTDLHVLSFVSQSPPENLPCDFGSSTLEVDIVL